VAGEDDTVVVGRIGRAHGIRGEVSVEPRTDEPERRFAVGNVLIARAPDGVLRPGGFTVESSRWHQGRLLLRLAGLADRTAAEAARGTLLEVPLDPAESPDDPVEFYDHQLVGLAVEAGDGLRVGTVADVEHTGAQDLLHIELTDGRTVLFPFVAALVSLVDVPGGRLVVDDRPGLLAPDPAED
jgi:16S rRNA processing protein RimM